MTNSELNNIVSAELLEYVSAKYGSKIDFEITAQTPLLKAGIIDSLSMVSFILFLEKKYKLDFLTIEITRDQFASIELLAAFVTNILSRILPPSRQMEIAPASSNVGVH